MSEAQISKLGQKYGEMAERRLHSWQNLIKEIENLDDDEKLTRVNQFFNQMNFVDDIDHWHKKDYWASPVEFLITNGGDCEDFSIAKYYTLRQVGIPIEKLSIVYVKALRLNQAHMVLTYYATPKSTPLILDNLIPEIKHQQTAAPTCNTFTVLMVTTCGCQKKAAAAHWSAPLIS